MNIDLAMQSFQTNGFHTCQNFLTQDQLQTTRSNVTEVLASLHKSCDLEWIQHIHTLPEGQWLHHLAVTTASPVAAHLLQDPNPILYSSQIAVRLPSAISIASTPWHQDGAGAGVCTFWIALDRIDSTNGGLQVMPGKHMEGSLPLKQITEEKDLDNAINMASHNVYEVVTNKSNIFKYRLRAGGAGVHHDSLPHCAGANRSNKPRRVIILRYMKSDTKPAVGQFKHYRTGEMINRTYTEGSN